MSRLFQILVLFGLCGAAHAAQGTTEARIERLERQLALIQQELVELRRAEGLAVSEISTQPVRALTPAAPAAADLSAQNSPLTGPQIDWQSDFRVRYEATDAHAGSPERHRGVIRGRLGAQYAVTSAASVGARIVTGNPDDPNSSDVSMGNVVDDLQVSLDQLFLRHTYSGGELLLGKMPNVLTKTDLVWDSDVNLYGAQATYNWQGEQLRASVRGVYSTLDEQVAGSDSNLFGVQAGFGSQLEGWAYAVDLGYYDYRLGSLNRFDTGDLRDNLLNAGGSAYLSDYDLFNVIASANFSVGTIPVQVVGDFVKNLGAENEQDTGFSVLMSAGRLSQVGDLQFKYGYTVAETDAVLGVVSHDNLTFATNYRAHMMEVQYQAAEKIWLYLTGYHYRRDELLNGLSDEWVSRLRLNLHIKL